MSKPTYTLKHWTPFRGKPNTSIRSDGIRVTLSPHGVIYMNSKAWDALGSPEAVELMFDPGRRVIGLKPIHPWEPYSFPVMHKNSANGKVIYASPFCVDINVRPKRTVVFNQAHMEEDGVMELPIDSITAVTRGSR